MHSQTIIFDLDGTISDPFEGISRSVNYALEARGYDAVEPARIRPMIGPPLTEIFVHLLGDVGCSRMDDLVASYRERYASIGYAENSLYAGMPEAIAALSAAGRQLGVCTSKRADYAARIVEMFGLGKYFAFVDGGDVHIKKYMQLERLIASGIDAHAAIMIGDRAIDIEAAKINRMGSVGVSWGFGAIGELERARPDYLVRSPAELREIFI